MYQAKFNLGIMQETKLTDSIYVREFSGFYVFAPDVPSRHHGGAALFYKEAPRFAVETHQQHVPNFIIFQLVMGEWRWYVVGCYLAPSDASTL